MAGENGSGVLGVQSEPKARQEPMRADSGQVGQGCRWSLWVQCSVWNRVSVETKHQCGIEAVAWYRRVSQEQSGQCQDKRKSENKANEAGKFKQTCKETFEMQN